MEAMDSRLGADASTSLQDMGLMSAQTQTLTLRLPMRLRRMRFWKMWSHLYRSFWSHFFLIFREFVDVCMLLITVGLQIPLK